MNHEKVYQWTETIANHFDCLNSWQIDNLGLFSYGAALARSSRLIDIALCVFCGEKVASAAKRLQRFVDNDKWLDDEFFIQWSHLVLSALPDEDPILLVDETKLSADYGVMMMGVAFENRCLPLVWQCYVANSSEDYPREGQVEMIVGMLRLVQQAMPEGKRATVMADRGIGCSSNLYRKVHTLGSRLLFRINKQSKMVVNGEELLIYDQVERGGEWKASGDVFKGDAKISAHIRNIWRSKYKQPWLLLTNDEQLSGHEYGKRNHQEQSFRDLKSGGFRWESSRIKCPQRMRRLVALLAIAYAFMVSLGCHAVEQGCTTHLIGKGKARRRKWSVFREGVMFFLEHVNRKGLWFPFALFADKRFT